MTTHGVAAFPLYWPLEHKRATYRREARFLEGTHRQPGQRRLGLDLRTLGSRGKPRKLSMFWFSRPLRSE
jgi:hypothetical protein